MARARIVKKFKWYSIPVGDVRIRWGHACRYSHDIKTASINLASIIDGVSRPRCTSCGQAYERCLRAEVYSER